MVLSQSIKYWYNKHHNKALITHPSFVSNHFQEKYKDEDLRSGWLKEEVIWIPQGPKQPLLFSHYWLIVKHVHQLK